MADRVQRGGRSYQSSRRAARRRRSVRAAAWGAPAIILTAVLLFGAASGHDGLRTSFGQLQRSLMPSAWALYVQALSEFSGLTIDQVSVGGHRFTADGDIFGALQLQADQSLLGFDVAGARARIESLPWVKTATLTRIYPGQLDVSLVERQAFAVWRHDDGLLLIDRDGRVLGATNDTVSLNLPRVSGDGAAKKAAGLMALISHHPDLSKTLDTAEFIAGRRWALRLKNGVVIHLPVERAALALRLFMRGETGGLTGRHDQIVDLRATGRVSIRPRKPLTIGDLARRSG